MNETTCIIQHHWYAMTLPFHSSRDTHLNYFQYCSCERFALRVGLSCPVLQHDQWHDFARLPGIRNGLVRSHSADPWPTCGLNYDRHLPARYSLTKCTHTYLLSSYFLPPQLSSKAKCPWALQWCIPGKLIFQQDH